MDTVRKGDKITADWANALTNAVNAVTHGVTALRGGGEIPVKTGYTRGARPLAFDLTEITDDQGDSLQGTISGGLLFYSTKTDFSANSTTSETEETLSVASIKIEDLVDNFSSGDKVWVTVTYDDDSWTPTEAKLEKGGEIPTAAEGESKAYFAVGEFKTENSSVFYEHYGLTSIKWDPIKWRAGVGPGQGLEWQTEHTDGCEEGLKWLKIKIDTTSVTSPTEEDRSKMPVDLSVSPNGLKGQILLSDSWTVLACDSDHAIRLRVDSNTKKLYIQQGEYLATSQTYNPIN